MKFSECLPGMRVRYVRAAVTSRHNWEGVIEKTYEDTVFGDKDVTVKWDNGQTETFGSHYQYFVPIATATSTGAGVIGWNKPGGRPMTYADCAEKMRIAMQRPGGKLRMGIIKALLPKSSNSGAGSVDRVEVVFDEGGWDVYDESIRYMWPLEQPKQSAGGKSDVNEDLKFFASVPADCCPCGILKSSKRCNFH